MVENGAVMIARLGNEMATLAVGKGVLLADQARVVARIQGDNEGAPYYQQSWMNVLVAFVSELIAELVAAQ